MAVAFDIPRRHSLSVDFSVPLGLMIFPSVRPQSSLSLRYRGYVVDTSCGTGKV